MLNTKHIVASAAVVGSIFASNASAAVKLPNVISDHMVLQRETSTPIWGTATPGEKVTVKFRDQEKTAEAGKDGKWIVKLTDLKVGGPDELTVKGENAITIKDVLVGEVWLGSGQSNMQMTVPSFTGKDKALEKLADASYPNSTSSVPTESGTKRRRKASRGFRLCSFRLACRCRKSLTCRSD